MSTAGSTSTLLYYPYDLDFDGFGYMYVVDYYNHRIQRFAPGNHLSLFLLFPFLFSLLAQDPTLVSPLLDSLSVREHRGLNSTIPAQSL